MQARPACRFGCDVRGASAAAMTATCGGCLVTDLQPASARHTAGLPQDALLFGPLPCRAENIANRAAAARKRMYGLPLVPSDRKFQQVTSRRGTARHTPALSGSTPGRPASLEPCSCPLVEVGGSPQAHNAASLWRRLAGESVALSLSDDCAPLICHTSCPREPRPLLWPGSPDKLPANHM